MIPALKHTSIDQFQADLATAAEKAGFTRIDSRTWGALSRLCGPVILTTEPWTRYAHLLAFHAPEATRQTLPPEFDPVTRIHLIITPDAKFALDKFTQVTTTLHIQPATP